MARPLDPRTRYRLLRLEQLTNELSVRGATGSFTVMGGASASPVAPRTALAFRPAASEAYAGRLIRLKDLGEPEQLQVCVQDSLGGWEWVTIGLASQ